MIRNNVRTLVLAIVWTGGSALGCMPLPATEVSTVTSISSTSISAAASVTPTPPIIEENTVEPPVTPSQTSSPPTETTEPRDLEEVFSISTLRVWVIQGLGSVAALDSLARETPAVVDTPDLLSRSSHLSFSPNGTFAAYILESPQVLLSTYDFTIQASGTSVILDASWLREALDEVQPIQWIWGPGESSLVVLDKEWKNGTVVDLISLNTYSISSGCANYAISSGTATGAAIYCEYAGSFVLELAVGGVREVAQPERSDLHELDYAVLGPEATTLVGVDTAGGFQLYQSEQNRLSLPVKKASDNWQIEESVVFASSGARVAVYGYSERSGICPGYLSEELGKVVDRPCWQLFSIETGDLIWYPQTSLAEQLGFDWERLIGTDSSFALSPDGEYYALSLRDFGLSYLIIGSTSNESVETAFDFSPAAMRWTTR